MSEERVGYSQGALWFWTTPFCTGYERNPRKAALLGWNTGRLALKCPRSDVNTHLVGWRAVHVGSPAEPPQLAAVRGRLKSGIVAPGESVPLWIQQDKLDPDKGRAHDCILRGPEQTQWAFCTVCFTLLSQLRKARHHGTNINISWALLNRQSEFTADQQLQYLATTPHNLQLQL